MTDLSRIKPSPTARASYIYIGPAAEPFTLPRYSDWCLWEELEEEHGQLVIETLARLMVNAVLTGEPQGVPND